MSAAIPRPAAAPARPALLRWLTHRDTLLSSAFIAGFLVLWQAVYWAEVMPRWAFPSPGATFKALWDMLLDGSLAKNVGASFSRQVTGVVLAAIAGVPLGIYLGMSPWFRGATLPFMRMLYPIPGLAWVPLAILWFGVGFTSTVFVIFISGIWPIMFNTATGVQTLSGQYTDVAKVYMAPRWLYVRHILVPGSLPFIITGLRLTYGVGWRVIIGAEMISSIVGIGFLIDDARWQLRPDIMIAGMITIAIIGLVTENWLFDFIERRTLDKWGMKASGL
jgi:ABC-type nitrate/sulfonate/bicarbonate transport system permease component